MRLHPLFIASLLPLASQAQTVPHFYVGAGTNLLAGANLLTNTPLSSGVTSRLFGPSVTAGWQFIPSLALQASVTYQWKTENYASSYTYTSPNGELLPTTFYSSEHKIKCLTIPVLLRYTFAPSAERLHFDALGGVTLTHATLHSTFLSSGPNSTEPDYYTSNETRANLTLGPAVRYTISPNIELTANGLVSAILNAGHYSQFSDRLFLNVLVGAHYTFGQR
jgi:hypothetical protein